MVSVSESRGASISSTNETVLRYAPWPEFDGGPVSLNDYLAQESRALVQQQACYRSERVNRVAVRFGALGLTDGDSFDIANDAVDGVLGGFSLNAVPDTCDIYQEICDVCNEAVDRECQWFVFIYDSDSGRNAAKRQKEIDSFFKIPFPTASFRNRSLEKKELRVEAKNGAEIKRRIDDFFKREARQALHASVVFVGFRSPKGFCLRNKQQPINTDDIKATVGECWDELKRNDQSSSLPLSIEIIFAEYDQQEEVHCDRFEVVRLIEQQDLSYSFGKNVAFQSFFVNVK